MPSVSQTQVTRAQPRRGSGPLPRRQALCLLLFLVAGSLSGCAKELIKSLGDMARLQADLVKEFHEPDINVVIQNSRVLGITFINSALNNQPAQKRMERAQQTAVFVRSHYAGIDRIERMWVSFTAHETRYLIVNYTRGIDTFGFDKKGLMLGPPAGFEALQPDPESDDEARTRYSTARDDTDVSIMRLQLSGDMTNGVALVPHFNVRGNATSADHPTTPPREVDFTFCSYAPQKVFKTDAPFAIIADGKTIFSSTASNTSRTTEGGNEFLTQIIPFSQFLEMTHARKASLTLADKQYRLTDKQLAELRKMASFVTAKEP